MKFIESFYSYWKNKSIRIKVVYSFFLSSLIGIFLISSFSYFMSNKILEDKILNDMQGKLHLIHEKLNTTIEQANFITKLAIIDNTIQDNLLSVSDEPEYTKYLKKMNIENQLNRLVYPNSFVRGIRLYRYGDDVIYSTRDLLPDGDSVRGEFEKQNLIHHPDAYYTLKPFADAFRFRGSLIRGLSLYRPVFSGKTGKELGYIETFIDEQTLSDLYSHKSILEEGSLFLIDSRNIVLSSSETDLFSKTLPLSPERSYSEYSQGNLRARIQYEDDKYILISHYMEEQDWVLIALFPVKFLTLESLILTSKILIAVIISAGFTLLIARFLSHSLTTPILTLQDSIALSMKDLSHRAKVESEDEVGVLATEYNELLSQLEKTLELKAIEEKNKRKLEMAMLQAQMNPHFLYNVLESICGLIDLKRDKDAQHLISELSRFYRGVLSRGDDVISLREELTIVEHYLNILNIRYNGKIQFTNKIDDAVLDQKIVKMTLQPLIENGIYHGLKGTSPPWRITLDSYVKKGCFYLDLRDYGTGLKSLERRTGVSGFGLSASDKRLKLFFGRTAGIKLINHDSNGCTARIRLPFTKETKEGFYE